MWCSLLEFVACVEEEKRNTESTEIAQKTQKNSQEKNGLIAGHNLMDA
jgi:hypothetical protein